MEAPESVTATPSHQDEFIHQTMGVDTPENIRIEYPLAGMGSRFAALLIDGMLITLAAVSIPLLVILAGHSFLGESFMKALLILYIFLLLWGYFLYFEAFRDGQTPGKRMLSIRVVMEGGYPVSVEAAGIRNLIRFIDVQPFPSCLLGGLSMILHSQSRRLGDLAAGTVVVRELSIEFPEVAATGQSAEAMQLSDQAYQALEAFVDRESALTPATATRLAHALEQQLPKTAESPINSPVARLKARYASETARRQTARLRLKSGSAAATALLKRKRSSWIHFRSRVRRVRSRGMKALSEQDVSEFAERFREISADLARSRTYGASAETLFALERVVGAGHNLFYRPARQSIRRLLVWLAVGFPRLVRRRWKPIAIASLLLYGPALVLYLLLVTHPELEHLYANSDMIVRAERAMEPGVDYRDTWGEVWIGSTYLSSALIANNIQVSFLAFASGISACIGTIVLLAFNGLSLGSAFAVFTNRGVLENILAFVAPHGFIELTAICIAGGAGLWMGSALILPGRERRFVALASRAKEAVSLVAGVGVMLLVAGTIEGFLSPARIAPELKLAAGVIFALATLRYLLGAGREPAKKRRVERAATELHVA